MNTQDWWAGQGGTAYTERNRVNWVKRIPFWTQILAITGAQRIHEVGCNFGANLLALRAINPKIELSGVDLNDSAIAQARNLHLDACRASEHLWTGGMYDLVFTAGCLIHVSPDAIKEQMRAIVANSQQYVLAVEYDAEKEIEIPYRGERGLLWKRNYGKLYEDLGCKELMSGYLNDADGFDKNGVTFWLLVKQDKQESVEVHIP